MDLSGLASGLWPLSVYADTGGLVDLSGLTGRWSSRGFTYQASLRAASSGQIRIPGVRELDRAELSIAGTGIVPTDQLQSITDSRVVIDGATASFGALRDQAGTTFVLSHGGQAVFGALPRIIIPPASQTVVPGVNVEFTVAVDGVGGVQGALVVNWQSEGETPGAAAASYVAGVFRWRPLVPSGDYWVERSENLSDWTRLERLSAASGTLSFEDSQAGSRPSGYYRLTREE